MSVLEVIRAIRDPVRTNRCLLGVDGCPLRPKCSANRKLIELEKYIGSYLRGITLDKLSHFLRRRQK